MKRKNLYKTPALLATLLATISACGQPEPLRTVSDGCLTFKRLSAEPEPEAGAEDLNTGNQYDTDITFLEILVHNEKYDRICKENGNAQAD